MSLNTPIHTNEQSIDRVLRAGRPVVLVFWRNECPPCEQLNPILDRLAEAYAGKALIAKVDVRDNPALSQRYGITRLPGLVFVKDGTTVAQANGAIAEAALRSWMEHLVAGGPRPAPTDGPSIPLDGAAGPGSEQQGTAQAPGSGAPLTLSDATFDRVIGGDLPVLVDFWAPWCAPCRAVAPTVERLAQEFAGRAIVAKLNVDENPHTSQRFGITGIPALLVFQGGQVVERLLGAQPAPALRQALVRHVSSGSDARR